MIVPFGRRKMIGVVVDNPAEPSFDPKQIKPIEGAARPAALRRNWLRLARFAAEYYQRPLGEVMLPTLPPPLQPSAYQGNAPPAGRWRGWTVASAKARAPAGRPAAGAERCAAGGGETLAAMNGFKPVLLYGVTGRRQDRGLRAAERVCWPRAGRCC